MSEVFHSKHRPTTFDDVVGQATTVGSLQQIIEDRSSRAFLLSGPSGVGKTTLARIGAREFGCSDRTIMEIDAATYTGIDQMRLVQETLRYRPFGKTAERAIIVDECHALSKAAWMSLLKPIEEPPEHASWWFCTTDLARVPDTIKTRCTRFHLTSLNEKRLRELYNKVATKEKIKLRDDIIGLIIREARGSARQLLVNMTLCRDVGDRRQAADVLRTVVESDPVYKLCQFLVKGRGSWTKAMALFQPLVEENPEGVRIVVVNYVGAALRNAKNDREACFFLGLLDAFSLPYNPAEGTAPLLQSIGRVLYAPQD